MKVDPVRGMAHGDSPFAVLAHPTPSATRHEVGIASIGVSSMVKSLGKIA